MTAAESFAGFGAPVVERARERRGRDFEAVVAGADEVAGGVEEPADRAFAGAVFGGSGAHRVGFVEAAFGPVEAAAHRPREDAGSFGGELRCEFLRFCLAPRGGS